MFPLYLARTRTRFGDAGRDSARRAAAAEGPRRALRRGALPGRPRGRTPPTRGEPLRPRPGTPQPARVGVNSEPGAAVPRSGPREAGKVGAGTSPPLSPRFPRAVMVRRGSRGGSPQGEGLGAAPTASPRQERSAAPRHSFTAWRPAERCRTRLLKPRLLPAAPPTPVPRSPSGGSEPSRASDPSHITYPV